MSLALLLKVALISSSGALAPGPLTAATAAIGVKKGWKGGFMVSVGHMVVELPLVFLIGMGIATFASEEFSIILSFVGGAFLLFFAFLTARDAVKVRSLSDSSSFSSPVIVGISPSALNPFFIAWWLGVGSPLILEAVALWGIAGIGLLYAAHVWLDFAWLTSLAKITSLSGFSLKFYKILLFALAILVAIFGIDFIYYGFTKTHLLPF
ncbi:MAG: LysE family transporter [Archaeoglobus sp.]|nr:LysE family transporter [Archaeoglobus sp.]